MRIPLTRNSGDESPIAWWEYFFIPVLLAVFLIVIVPLTVWALFCGFVYPDQHLTKLDWGTAREQELAKRYRRYTWRAPFWRRVWNVMTCYPCRKRKFKWQQLFSTFLGIEQPIDRKNGQ
jgi:hypothetical protein